MVKILVLIAVFVVSFASTTLIMSIEKTGEENLLPKLFGGIGLMMIASFSSVHWGGQHIGPYVFLVGGLLGILIPVLERKIRSAKI